MSPAHDAIRLVPLMLTLSGALIAAVCWPLMQGKVGPNRLYGIRTRAAFQSPENWYRLNRLGGKILFRAGLVVAVTGLVGLCLPASWLIGYSCVAAVITLVSISGSGVYLLFLK